MQFIWKADHQLEIGIRISIQGEYYVCTCGVFGDAAAEMDFEMISLKKTKVTKSYHIPKISELFTTLLYSENQNRFEFGL